MNELRWLLKTCRRTFKEMQQQAKARGWKKKPHPTVTTNTSGDLTITIRFYDETEWHVYNYGLTNTPPPHESNLARECAEKLGKKE